MKKIDCMNRDQRRELEDEISVVKGFLNVTKTWLNSKDFDWKKMSDSDRLKKRQVNDAEWNMEASLQKMERDFKVYWLA